MHNSQKKIYVIGGCGFLGLETVKLLKRNNYDVVIADLPYKNIYCPKDIPFISMDITNLKSLNNFNIKKKDIIINLASRQYINKVPYFKRKEWFSNLNHYGAINLMNKAINSGAGGYIFFSSDFVYGIPKNIPVLETFELKPLAEYGHSKKDAEKELIEKSKNILPLTIFRPRLISGPGRTGVFETLFKFIHHSFPVPLIGNGNNCYQMVSVFDCANAILLAIEKNLPNEIFNLGSKKIIKVKDLIKELIRLAQSGSITIPLQHNIVKSLLYFLDKIGMTVLYPEQFMIADKNYIVDINKAKKYLGWTPQFNDQQMINSAYEYWLKLKKTLH